MIGGLASLRLLPLAGLQFTTTMTATPTLAMGLHQIVVEYFNGQGAAALSLVITDQGRSVDASSSFLHDPADPCNADCSVCNTAQQYCLNCTVATSTPVGGVCTSPLSVMG